ncbi:MAG TPA: hypothetical protein VMU38_06855 [Candidatus Binatia bacterium]|nr:hypothetical protein [Candidatus Binatia bacterium]
MKLTITAIACAFALSALALTASAAQTSYTLSGTCKVSTQKSIQTGETGRTFAVSTGKCTDKETINGEASTGGQYAEYSDSTATQTKSSGIYAVTFKSGDKILYQYDITLAMKGNTVESGSGTFSAISGTGKMKGIAAKGTCTFSAGPAPMTNNFTCTGSY